MISSTAAMPDPIVQPIDKDLKEIKGQIETGKARFGEVSSEEGKLFRSKVQEKIATLNTKIAKSFENKTLSEPTIKALISLRGEINQLNNEIKTVDTRIVDYNKTFKPTFFQKILSWIGLGPKPVETVDFIRDDLITSGIQGARKQLAEAEIKHGIEYTPEKDLFTRMDKIKAQLPSGSFALFGIKSADNTPCAIGVQVMEKEDGKKPAIRTYAILLSDDGYNTGTKVCASFSEALNLLGAKEELKDVEQKLLQAEQKKQLEERMNILTDRTHFVPDCKIQAEAESILKGYEKGAYIVWKDDKGYHLSGKNQQGDVKHEDIKLDSFVKAKGSLAEFIKGTGFSKPVGAIKVAEFFNTIKPLLDTHPESNAQVRAQDVMDKMERDKPYFLLRKDPGKNGFELVTLKKVKPLFRGERIDAELKTFTVSGDGQIAGVGTWEQFQNTEMKGFIPLRSVESRSHLLENIRALGPYSYSKENELTSRMQQFVDVMGAKATGCYCFYTVKSVTEKPELHLCYVQEGKVLTKPVDVTSDTALQEFTLLSGDALLSKLLEKASVAGLDRAKGFPVLDSNMKKIELKLCALGTKEHIQNKDEALADLQNVAKTFGEKAYGAYVLYQSPDDKGKVIARVYDQTGEKEYTLDLAANPGSITIGKEVVEELPKWAVQGCKVYNDQIAEFDSQSKKDMPGYFDSGTTQGATQVQDMLKHASLVGANDIWFVHRMPYQEAYKGSLFNPIGVIGYSIKYGVNYAKNALGWIQPNYSLTVVHRQDNLFKMLEKEITINPKGGFTLDRQTKNTMDEAVNSMFSELAKQGISISGPKVSAVEVEKKWAMIDAKERKLATLDAKVGKDVGKQLAELDGRNPAVRHYNITPQESTAEKLSQSFNEAGKNESREILHRFPKGYTLTWGNKTATIDLYTDPGKYTVNGKKYDTIEELLMGVTGQSNMKSLVVGLKEKREADKAAEQKILQEEADAKLTEVDKEIDIPIARTASQIELPKLDINNNDRWVQVGSRLTIAHDWWVSKGKPTIGKDDAVLLLRQILAVANSPVWGKGGQLGKLAKVVETAKEIKAEDMGLAGRDDAYYESQNDFLDVLVKSAGIG